MCRSLRFIPAFIALAVVPLACVQAQERKPSTDSGWFSLYAGPQVVSDSYGGTVGITVSVGSGIFHQAGIYNSFTSFSHIWSVSYARGLGSIGQYYRTVVFLGPAIAFGVDHGDPAYVTAGLAMNATATVKALKIVGVGVSVFANVNFKESVGGFGLVLAIDGPSRQEVPRE